jgi:hypothetical protein
MLGGNAIDAEIKGIVESARPMRRRSARRSGRWSQR